MISSFDALRADLREAEAEWTAAVAKVVEAQFAEMTPEGRPRLVPFLQALCAIRQMVEVGQPEDFEVLSHHLVNSALVVMQLKAPVPEGTTIN